MTRPTAHFAWGYMATAPLAAQLEKMLAEVSAEDTELRREISYAIEQLDAPDPQYEPEAFDIYAEYPKRTLPPFDVLEESDRLDLVKSSDADVRAGAAHSFFNQELSGVARKGLLDAARADDAAFVAGKHGHRSATP